MSNNLPKIRLPNLPKILWKSTKALWNGLATNKDQIEVLLKIVQGVVVIIGIIITLNKFVIEDREKQSNLKTTTVDLIFDFDLTEKREQIKKLYVRANVDYQLFLTTSITDDRFYNFDTPSDDESRILFNEFIQDVNQVRGIYEPFLQTMNIYYASRIIEKELACNLLIEDVVSYLTFVSDFPFWFPVEPNRYQTPLTNLLGDVPVEFEFIFETDSAWEFGKTCLNDGYGIKDSFLFPDEAPDWLDGSMPES